MTYCLGKNRLEQQYNVLQVRLRPGLVPDLSALERTGFSHGGCGLCGKRQIDALSVRLKPAFASFPEQISPAVLLRLSAETRQHQRLFRRSGGTHAAALFSPAGELLGLQEDIGRHNAVDKLIGAQLLANAQILSGSLLFLSGRASFELIQKALRASIPIVVAVGAPSSLAVDLAQHYGQTLVGFMREQRFNIYAGGERLAL
jgi:FdhD protein